MIKVMIADDQELIRQSLQIVLEMKEGIEVTATAKDGREVIQEVRKDKPDVILMDVRMPEMDGVQCTQIIKEQYPDVKIIILTTFDDDEYVYNVDIDDDVTEQMLSDKKITFAAGNEVKCGKNILGYVKVNSTVGNKITEKNE